MEIKGVAVKSIKEYVLKTFPDKYASWYSSLSDNSKKCIDSAVSSGWYPLNDGAIEPTQKIREIFFNGDLKKGGYESGKYSAKVALNGIYKMYVKLSSAKHIIDRASRILPAYYQPSEMKVLESQKKSLRLSMTNCPGINPVIEYRIAGWIEQALEISGCDNVKVDVAESILKNKRETIFDCKWN